MRVGKEEIVIDTNVAVVASRRTPQAGQNCIRECATRLRYVIDQCRVLLDDRNEIFGEYKRYLSFSGQPELGDAFFKWLFENQANPEHCRKVPISPHQDRGFEEFPDDPALSSFDPDDRKFVAVALASGTSPKVLNASDTDWWLYRNQLRQHGIEVVFLCLELMPV